MSRTSTAQWRRIRAQAIQNALNAGQLHCPICRAPIDWTRSGQPSSPEADHIIPAKKGGPDHITNVRIICRTCNRRLGAKNTGPKKRPPITPHTHNTW